MRDYAKVGPTFWIGKTGRALRAAGMEAQLVGLYLLTNPHANMLGLYYLPLTTIVHETGIPLEGASKGLQRAIEAGFCSYDATTEVVWVHEMAAWQVGEQLDPKDKRCAGIQKDYDALLENPFLARFYGRYRGAFHLVRERQPEDVSVSPLEAPSEPHRSQEQEQEQEQEQKSKTPPTPPADPPSPPAPAPAPAPARTRRGAPEPFTVDLPEWLPAEAWLQWERFRLELQRTKKTPWTPEAAKVALDTLTRLREQGHAPAEVLSQSILSGWAGLFPLKGGTAAKQPPRAAAPLPQPADYTAGMEKQADGSWRF